MKRFLPVLASLLLLGGCLQIQMDLVLEEDHSGTVAMDLGIDLESMVYMSAMIDKMFSGEEGAPTEEDLQKAREEMLAQESEDEPFDAEKSKAEMQADVPEGVEVLDVQQAKEGLKTTYKFRLGFDHVDRLKAVKLSPDEPGAEGGPGSGGDVETPFSGLALTDEGSTWLVSTPPLDPVTGAEEQMESSPFGENMGEMVAQMFGNLRIAYSIRVPGPIVEHNAHRVEGQTLYWEYDLVKLNELRQSNEEVRVFVRYRK